MNTFKKLIAVSLIYILTAGSLPVFYVHAEGIDTPAVHYNISSGTARGNSYASYIAEFASADMPESTLRISGADFSSDLGADVSIRNYQGRDNVVYWDSQTGSLEWTVQVPEDGLYNIGITYNPIANKNSDIQMAVYIDGQIPFTGADSFVLNRIWRNESNDFREDSRGNQLRPRQLEVFKWTTAAIKDSTGKYNDPYKFYFSKGEHTVRLEIISETLAISELKLYQEIQEAAYDSSAADTSVTGHFKLYEAEQTFEKSHSTLYPTEDRGNPATRPSHPYLVRLNTLGKTTYRLPGQWVSWQLEVPEDGYYCLAFKVRQNVQRGMYSTRRIYIDGEVPFAELNNVKFPYGVNWYNKTLGDNNPYLFYLTKGTHEVKMEITTGDLAEVLGQLDDIIFEMNTWYRKIIMITGSNPDAERQFIDTNRDFLLDQKIPGLMDGFADLADRLQNIKKTIDSVSMDNGNTASILDEVTAQLRSFVRQPETIPSRLDSYKGNVSTLSTTVLDMREQPLEIDYFAVFTPDMAGKLPRANAGIFSTLKFRAEMFISTFVQDYSNVGEIYTGDPLDVWVSTSDIAMTGISSGRDQAQIIKSMVDDLFVPETDIGVNISLVNSSEALIQAVLAGKGPDVAMFISKETPVNLAIRGALVDLTQFDDFEEAAANFHESALIPYYFDGKAYALPETQNFDVLFYRTDIFEELGLKVPETWEEFHALTAILQINNMMAGIPESQRTFEMLLYQNKGSFYNENLSRTAFDQPEALNAFKQWTGLYSRYGLPLVFDFFSRFRTGEMPIAIMPYTQSNYLTAAAPEIKNLWDMAPVPGTVMEDGTINNAVTSYGTGAIAIKGTGKEEEAWKFIKWWTGTEAQARFGNELEQLMGASARYPTANKAAFDLLPWSAAQAGNLKKQWESVTDIPQVPGNYYISRNISFAFRAVVISYKNERETLNKYNKEINKEIRRKRLEFGLEAD